MRSTFTSASFGIALALYFTTAWAPSQERTPCTVETKSQLYKLFLAAWDGSPQNKAEALTSGKQYLACATDSTDKPEELANVNLVIGRILISKGFNDEAVGYLISAVSFESSVRRQPQAYADLAQAYFDGPYARLAEDYQLRFQGKDDSAESRDAVMKLFPLIDCMIDAYARAVALSGTEVPRTPPEHYLRGRTGRDPSDWMESLIALHTFRKKGYLHSDLKDYVHRVLSTPLPPNPIVANPKNTR